MYGIAVAALGMLATLTIGLTIDCYGPISDNAGGIVEMSGMGPETRQRTDALDAAGNTTAAIGKGFAIGSAALVAMALFGAFCERAKIVSVDMLSPWTMFGTMLGTVLPFAFSAITMKAVGMAANDMVEECRRQFPLILNGTKEPDYTTCIQISTQASFKQMFKAGGMVLLAPTVGGVFFGKNFTAGLLTGSLYCGVLFAICMSNSGGAWDNAKKYIEAGGLGMDHLKGSTTHKNAVVGDTVGDPLKDTSGPSLNILVKLGAIMSLVFADTILSCSNAVGGPRWAF
jgi:inorganic pyrophosphatase